MNQRKHSRTVTAGRYPYARYRHRLAAATALSLFAHAFILSLRFGLPGLGLPGLQLPWDQRRAQPSGLSITLAPARPARPAASEPMTERAAMPATVAVPVPPIRAAMRLPSSSGTPPRTPSGAASSRAASAEKATARRSAVPASRQPTRSRSGARIIAQADAAPDTFAVTQRLFDEPAPAAPSPADAPPDLFGRPPQDTSPGEAPPTLPEDAAKKEAEQRQALELEARRQDEEDAQRQAAALALQAEQKRAEEQSIRRAREQEAQQLAELRRQEEERAARAASLAQEAEARRQAEEAGRLAEQQRRQAEYAAARMQELEAKKHEELRQQEEARRQAQESEARRQAEETARRQAAQRQQQAEELAARQKAEAEAREREHSLAGSRLAANDSGRPGEPAGGPGGNAPESAQRSDALRITPPLQRQPPETTDAARRRSVLGRVEQDVGLMMYVESWRLKIERNGRLNFRQSLVESAYTEPVVTVAVRADGSIENILFERRSGRAELDAAIERIIRLNARYSAFPPELARRYDVIEIRRVWNFDGALRLREEVR